MALGRALAQQALTSLSKTKPLPSNKETTLPLKDTKPPCADGVGAESPVGHTENGQRFVSGSGRCFLTQGYHKVMGVRFGVWLDYAAEQGCGSVS